MSCILTDIKLMTMAAGAHGFAQADSVLVENGAIRCIGTLRQCRLQSKTAPELISLEGKVLMPAFCDTHTHFVELSKGRFQLKLQNLSTIEQIRATAIHYRETLNRLPDWILGDGWDINRVDYPDQINRHLLDSVFPDVPVALFSKDYHAKWCNTQALRLSGLLMKSDLNFGDDLVKRDFEGLATGLIYEAATEYIDRFVTPPTESELRDAILQELECAYRLGLGGFHSMESAASANALARAQANGANFRYVWHFPLDDLDLMIGDGVKSYQDQGSFITGGVKIFGDGSLGSRTAAMRNPYTNDPGNHGVLRYSPDELDALIHKAAIAGISCTVHAIGDLTVHHVINCFNKYRSIAIHNNLLQRIEHVQAISTDDLIPLKTSGAYCALQPVHLANDVPMIEASWSDVMERAYRFADIARMGIPHGFGSDAPIETIDPFKGIYSAVFRHPGNDPALAAWFPDQRITIEEALWAYTYGAAMGSQSQSWKGSVEEGKAADLIAIDDWTGQPGEFWLEQQCRLCMVNGQINYIDI